MTSHRALAAGLAVGLLFALGACGDDDDGETANTTTTSEATTTSTGSDELCGSLDDLEQDVTALGDIDVVAEGTNAVEESVTTIEDDLAEVRQAVPDAAPEEADAFQSALASLGEAATAVGNESLTAESARGVITAVTATVDAGQTYFDALEDPCP